MQTDAPGTTYVVVQITNNSNIPNTDLHVFVQSKTQVYKITNGIASVEATPSGDAPSSSIHDLKQPDGTYSFKINQADDLTSGRIYFCDSKSAVQGLNGPSATSGHIFDFVELTITGNQSINLDTSQIDQFGIPITVQVNPKDPNFPNGTGIVAGLSRKSVITNFDTLTSEAAFAAYKDCKTSIPKDGTIPAAHRLIGPQHVIDGLVSPTSLAGNITGASHTGAADTATTYTATFTLTTSGQTFGSVTGYVAAGPGVPPGATVKQVVNTTTVTLESKKGKFLDLAGATLSFYSASPHALTTAMDEAIYRMFAHYKEHTLYLVANGHVAGMEIFEGKVITNFKLPQGLTDINGKTDTEYTVFQFTGTGYTYDGAKNTLTALPAVPAGQTNVYQVFYPYFSTNCAESPHSNALTAGGPPPPPEWFNAGWNTVLGNINIASPATLMALACADNFADSAYQEQAYQQTSAVLQDSTVLGNIENQLVTMLNRGITPNT
ncbi:MAG: beta-1,3-glucanase family protein, partial [Bacteroidota bacterium]